MKKGGQLKQQPQLNQKTVLKQSNMVTSEN